MSTPYSHIDKAIVHLTAANTARKAQPVDVPKFMKEIGLALEEVIRHVDNENEATDEH